MLASRSLGQTKKKLEGGASNLMNWSSWKTTSDDCASSSSPTCSPCHRTRYPGIHSTFFSSVRTYLTISLAASHVPKHTVQHFHRRSVLAHIYNGVTFVGCCSMGVCMMDVQKQARHKSCSGRCHPIFPFSLPRLVVYSALISILANAAFAFSSSFSAFEGQFFGL